MLYIYNTAHYADINVEIDPTLKPYSKTCFPVVVDGCRAAIDFSDFNFVDPIAWGDEVQAYFMFHHLPVFKSHRNIGSFPQASFTDWYMYNELSKVEYKAESDLILHKQECGYMPRRLEVRDMVMGFADFHKEPQIDFWKKALHCRASIHIPGSTSHCLDRGQSQLLGLGVCTISPDIWSTVCEEKFQPDIHYVRIRDDFSDLLEKVDWCRSHQDECVAIGRRAKEFFVNHATPKAIWSYIADKCALLSDWRFAACPLLDTQ